MKFKFTYTVALLSLPCAQGQLRAVRQWPAIYDGTGHGVDLPSAILLNKYRNFYITGRSVGDSAGMDIATIKYSSSGQEVLTLRYNEGKKKSGES